VVMNLESIEALSGRHSGSAGPETDTLPSPRESP